MEVENQAAPSSNIQEMDDLNILYVGLARELKGDEDQLWELLDDIISQLINKSKTFFAGNAACISYVDGFEKNPKQVDDIILRAVSCRYFVNLKVSEVGKNCSRRISEGGPYSRTILVEIRNQDYHVVGSSTVSAANEENLDDYSDPSVDIRMDAQGQEEDSNEIMEIRDNQDEINQQEIKQNAHQRVGNKGKQIDAARTFSTNITREPCNKIRMQLRRSSSPTEVNLVLERDEEHEKPILSRKRKGKRGRGSGPFTCPRCKDKFASRQSLLNHIGVVHYEKEISAEERAAIDAIHKTIKIKCLESDCNQTFLDRRDMLKHWKSVHQKLPKQNIKCPECTQTFTRVSNMRIHFKRFHLHGKNQNGKDNKLADMMVAGQDEQDAESFPSRKCKGKRGRGSGPFTCPRCKDKLASRKSLLNHIGVVHCEKEISAEERAAIDAIHKTIKIKCLESDCNQTFLDRGDMLKHWKSKHQKLPKQNIKCPECTQTFTLASNMKIHLKRFHSHGKDNTSTDINLVAGQEQQDAESFPSVERRRKRSKGSGRFTCPRCRGKFATKYTVLDHMDLKHDDKKITPQEKKAIDEIHLSIIIKCLDRDCNKTYHDKRDMRKHWRTVHINGKNQNGTDTTEKMNERYQATEKFTCKLCGKVYQRNANLSRHMNAEHNSHNAANKRKAVLKALKQEKDRQRQEKLTCPVCKNQYSSKYSLTQHVKKSHRKTKISDDVLKYTCKHCVYISDDRSDLLQHMRDLHLLAATPTGECEAVSSQDGNSKGHQFACYICNESFYYEGCCHFHLKPCEKSRTVKIERTYTDEN